MITIDPVGMGVVEWASQMALQLKPFGLVPILTDPEGWREWARTVISNQRIAAAQPPDPGFFDDWREWVHRFNQATYGLRN